MAVAQPVGTRHRVVIVGGGFGGLYAARQLSHDPEVALALVDWPAPGVAQGAMQGGTHAARTIWRRILGRPTEAFRYKNRGDVAVIGRLSGVTDIPWLGPFGRQGGFTAWLLWLRIHIFYPIGFADRIIVVTRWAFSFLTHGRGTRLITGAALLPPIEDPEPPVIDVPEDPTGDPSTP